MAWFRNHYQCERCGSKWKDDWSCMCDDDCRRCGARHMSPYKSDDLTEIIEPRKGAFVVLRSPDAAEHLPEYQEVASFPTRKQAKTYLESVT
jgi:predicted  nucleic acid-binding Zn-ribbon protein